MDFREQIDCVFNKVLIPKCSEFDYVFSKKYGDIGPKRFYEIVFVIKESSYEWVDSVMMHEIHKKASGLIDMIGLGENDDYAIIFRSHKNIRNKGHYLRNL